MLVRGGFGWLQGWKPCIPYSVSYEPVTVRSSDLCSLNSAHDAFSRTTREINKWLKSRGVKGKHGKGEWWRVAGWCHLTVLEVMSPSTVSRENIVRWSCPLPPTCTGTGDCASSTTPPPSDLNPEPLCNPTSSFWRSFSKVGGKLWRTMNYDYGKKRMWQSWRRVSLKKSTRHPECRGSHVKLGSLSSWWNLLSATQAAFEEERILCSPLQAWKAAEISMKHTGTCSL